MKVGVGKNRMNVMMGYFVHASLLTNRVIQIACRVSEIRVTLLKLKDAMLSLFELSD